MGQRGELLKKEPLLENSERKTKWKNSRTGLIQFWTVTILTIINYVQVYALIASLGVDLIIKNQLAS